MKKIINFIDECTCYPILIICGIHIGIYAICMTLSLGKLDLDNLIEIFRIFFYYFGLNFLCKYLVLRKKVNKIFKLLSEKKEKNENDIKY